MAATGIDIQHVVNINTEVEAALPQIEFGTGLMLTQDTTSPLAAGGARKARRFTSLAEVDDYFGEDSDVSKDAAVWFAADPKPKALYIGRWAKANINTSIESQELQKTATQFAAVTNGSLKIGSNSITGINFTGNSDYAAVATTLQTAIAAVISGTTVTYASDKFTIELPQTSDPGAIGTTGSGTDLTSAEWLGIADDGEGGLIGGVKSEGSSAESIAQCVERCNALADYGAPIALMLSRDVDETDGKSPATTTKTLMRQFADTGDYLYVTIESGSTVKGATDTTSEMATARSASSTHAGVIYTDDVSKRPDIAVLAKLSSQDFNRPNSIIQLVPKALQGVQPSSITDAEVNTLEAKNGSVYTNVQGLPTFLGGKTAGGTWLDSEWWITWLKTELENEIFNANYNSKRFNNAILGSTISLVMEKAYRSGGIQPGGVVSPAIRDDIRKVTGDQEFDGVLTAGYLLWMDAPQDQTPTDRAARIARFKIWITPSQAIQTVDGTITLSSG